MVGVVVRCAAVVVVLRAAGKAHPERYGLTLWDLTNDRCYDWDLPSMSRDDRIYFGIWPVVWHAFATYCAVTPFAKSTTPQHDVHQGISQTSNPICVNAKPYTPVIGVKSQIHFRSPSIDNLFCIGIILQTLLTNAFRTQIALIRSPSTFDTPWLRVIRAPSLTFTRFTRHRHRCGCIWACGQKGISERKMLPVSYLVLFLCATPQ